MCKIQYKIFDNLSKAAANDLQDNRRAEDEVSNRKKKKVTRRAFSLRHIGDVR